ncbi:MAG: histidine kinase [Actinobacteria bacterium]|uniref:histidine kinase n=1 Tax=freshwater metagenome TaxID=449393 RepID=A0A6J6BBN6_9ZZZZ|nr:histidine kinase [Actinomycetota bacterium]
MAWNVRRKRDELTPQSQSSIPASISSEVEDLLNGLDAETILLSSTELVIHESDGISSLGLVKESRINHEPLLLLLRTVRRTGKGQEATLELPRGPIGEGVRELLVRIFSIGADGLVAILIFDESEMRRLDSVRRDFVANISHELKTPIGALSILSEAVLGATDDPDAITRFATRMQIEATRLSDLVQEIIDLSRLQDDDPLIRATSISVSDTAREAIDQSKLHADSRQITLVFSSDDGVTTLGDRIQLTTAIHNLIENAINYSPESTRVAIAIKSQGNLVEVSVSDQGIGIPEKDLERIFERFYRVDPARSRETGGTGLGLSIVKHIVNNHGGDISVWSVEGAGTTFTIRLPRLVDQLSEEKQ